VPLELLVARVEEARRGSAGTFDRALASERAAYLASCSSDMHRAAAVSEMSQSARSPASKRLECPTCGHRWLDKYQKDECPKCLSKLSTSFMLIAKGGSRRVAGEVSTFKQPPGSAMESESGSCLFGGPHSWRFGRCSKCGRSEGKHVKASTPAGECRMGGRHVFMFTNRCTKCNQTVHRAFVADDEGLARAVPAQVQLASTGAASSRASAASVTPAAASAACQPPAYGKPAAMGSSSSVPTLRRDGQRRPASAGASLTSVRGDAAYSHSFLDEDDLRLLREWEIHQKTKQGAFAEAAARLDPAEARDHAAALRSASGAGSASAHGHGWRMRSRRMIKPADIGLTRNRSFDPGWKEHRRECPTCGHRWLDKYQKDEASLQRGRLEPWSIYCSGPPIS
jgi:hypothetical protein